MDTKWIVISVVLVLAIVGAVIYYLTRKKSLDQLFIQVLESSRQVPKQKKQSFLLFMFKESVVAAKTKNKTPKTGLNNPKYLEAQLLYMANILKDRSKTTDKTMKQALRMYDAYQVWEKSKLSKQ